jgi:hypothetical protein
VLRTECGGIGFFASGRSPLRVNRDVHKLGWVSMLTQPSLLALSNTDTDRSRKATYVLGSGSSINPFFRRSVVAKSVRSVVHEGILLLSSLLSRLLFPFKPSRGMIGYISANVHSATSGSWARHLTLVIRLVPVSPLWPQGIASARCGAGVVRHECGSSTPADANTKHILREYADELTSAIKMIHEPPSQPSQSLLTAPQASSSGRFASESCGDFLIR